MAALEALTTAMKKMAETTIKEGLKKGIDGLKEGKGLSESLKGGFDTMKETGFKEINNFLSPENAEKLKESSEKLNEIQDKIEFEPQNFAESQTEIVGDFNNATENINDISTDLNETLVEKGVLEEKGLTQEIKETLNEFKDILDQVKEIQDKLKELGVNPDMLSMLNSDASEIDDMEDAESTE